MVRAFSIGGDVKIVLMMCAAIMSFSVSAEVFVHRPPDRSLEKYGQRVLAVKEGMVRLELLMNETAKGGAVRNMVFMQCTGAVGAVGVSNPENLYFDPVTKNITVCYEYLRFLERKRGAGSMDAGRDQFLALIYGILHEYGHAITAKKYGAMVFGNSERSADAFAAILIKKTDMKREFLQAVLLSASRFALLSDVGRFLDAAVSGTADNDIHPYESKRRADAICWVAGDLEDVMLSAVQRGYITRARAEQCASESADIERRVEEIIGM